MIEKSELRKHYKKIRMQMPLKDKCDKDIRIFENFMALDEYKKSKDVLVYVSSYIEVDTHRIINKCFQDGKRVFAPRCVPDSNDMNFYEIKSFDDLEQGAFGIYEPKQKCIRIESFEKACCIVPALAYDQSGYRLGFGKGFYDKFLSNFNGKQIGICYSSCICGCLPHEKHDVAIEIVVTDDSKSML